MNKTIRINDISYKFCEGETILDIALKNNIDIPKLCHFQGIGEIGACRICLVEVVGTNSPLASCTTYATDNMEVLTESETLSEHRLQSLQFILLKHPLRCKSCDDSGYCSLQKLSKKLGVEELAEEVPYEKNFIDWQMMNYDKDACILCQRCNNACHALTGCNALDIDKAQIVVQNEPLDCDFCGICVDICPANAITDKAFQNSHKMTELTFIHTACPFCSVGCILNYGVYENKIEKVRRSGKGLICSKGRYGFQYVESKKRLLEPKKKINGVFAAVDWNYAIDEIHSKIIEIGADKSCIVVGSLLSNEEIFAYKELADVLGIHYLTEAEIAFGDFMHSYYDKFGQYESLGDLETLEKAQLIFVVGADLSREALGIKWSMLKSVNKNAAILITIGLQHYEYDEETHASILADYADFAKVFDDIKNDDSNFYKSIRRHISNFDKIAVIVGNEYFSGESDKDSILSFVDYIGKDKVSTFIPVNDKVNYVASLYSSSEKVEDIVKLKPEFFFFAAVNPNARKLLPLNDMLKETKYYVTPDLFIVDSVKEANLILPTIATLEDKGSYTTFYGKVIEMQQLVKPPLTAKSNLEIIDMIAKSFGKTLQLDSPNIFTNKDSQFKLTSYTYFPKEPINKVIYVNAKHQEGVLTKIIEGEFIFPHVETIIKNNSLRSFNNQENIAKGVTLIPKSIK